MLNPTILLKEMTHKQLARVIQSTPDAPQFKKLRELAMQFAVSKEKWKPIPTPKKKKARNADGNMHSARDDKR